MSTQDEWDAYSRLIQERTRELREMGVPYNVASDLAYWETRYESIDASRRQRESQELSNGSGT